MIRGIDHQIAVQRVNDLTKDASAQLRKAELTHDFQARINQAMEKREQQQVQKLEDKHDPRVSARQEGGGNAADANRKDKRKKKEQDPFYDDLFSGAVAADPAGHRLDIEV